MFATTKFIFASITDTQEKDNFIKVTLIRFIIERGQGLFKVEDNSGLAIIVLQDSSGKFKNFFSPKINISNKKGNWDSRFLQEGFSGINLHKFAYKRVWENQCILKFS